MVRPPAEEWDITEISEFPSVFVQEGFLIYPLLLKQQNSIKE